MTLAAGWIDKPIPRRFEKGVKGGFAHEAMDGATGFVVHYKGLGMTKGKAFDAGMKSLTIATPSLQPVEAEEAERGGNKANVAVLCGPVAGARGGVEVAGVVVTIKARTGFVNVIVVGPAWYQAYLKTHEGDGREHLMSVSSGGTWSAYRGCPGRGRADFHCSHPGARPIPQRAGHDGRSAR